MGVQLRGKTFREKISLFKRLQKTGRVCADLMSGGRLFQTPESTASSGESTIANSHQSGNWSVWLSE